MKFSAKNLRRTSLRGQAGSHARRPILDGWCV